MRVEVDCKTGNIIVCSHIYSKEQIKVGSHWQSSSGTTVMIETVEDGWVTYSEHSGISHTKDVFSFQCRYCLILDHPIKERFI